MYYSFYYINLLITMFLTIFWRFPKIFKMLSEGCTNVSEHFPRISEDCRRLPRKIRRFFDLISIYFGSFSIGTWQTLQADWSKMISHMCGYHFYPHVWVPFFSICYHSLYHCSLYNKTMYVARKNCSRPKYGIFPCCKEMHARTEMHRRVCRTAPNALHR